MRIPCQAAGGNFVPCLTPLVGVVLLLVLFLGLLSHKQQWRPLAADRNDRGTPLTVQVSKDGTLLFAGRQINPDELAGILRQQQSISGHVPVRIQADRRMSYALVEPVLVVCAQAGAGDVAFAVTP